MKIINAPSKRQADELAAEYGGTAQCRAYDDDGGPAGSWYVVVEEDDE